MTEIMLDPQELQDTAALLRGISSEVAELGGALPGVCCCEMPAGVVARVDAELGAAQSSVGEAAQGYGWAATDAATRGGLMAGDQALAGTMSSAWGGTSDWLAPMEEGGAVTADAGWSPNANDWLAPMATSGPVSSAGFTGLGASWTGAVTGDGAGSAGGYDGTGTWMQGMDTPVLTSDFPHYVAPPPATASEARLAGLLGGGGGVSGLTGSAIVTNTGNLAATTFAPTGTLAVASPNGLSVPSYVDGAGHVGSLGDVFPDPGGFGNVVMTH